MPGFRDGSPALLDMLTQHGRLNVREVGVCLGNFAWLNTRSHILSVIGIQRIAFDLP